MSKQWNWEFLNSRINVMWDVKAVDVLRIISYLMMGFGFMCLINDFPPGMEPPTVIVIRNITIGILSIISAYCLQRLVIAKLTPIKIKK